MSTIPFAFDLSPAGATGSLALLLALGFTLLGLTLSVLGALRSDGRLAEGGRRAAWGVFALATVAIVTLQIATLRDDFSVRYVAEHSMTVSPLWVKWVTLWAALEGSILLWAWVLALYAFILSFTARNDVLRPWVMAGMYLSLLFFVGLNLTVASPFTPVANPPAQGAGPNPLLQNHWMMAVHPVLLYIGYVGLAVPFSYAVAALVTGRLGESWISQIRRWTLIAWAFLSAAIVAGGWWSYEILGWGGYWAWDPVENASFIPWLLATAFLHSIQIQERRRMLKAWNVWLIVGAYATTVLGTFLTRSGVVESVHAFSEGLVGPALLGFMAVVLGLGVALAAWRLPLIRDEHRIDQPISREGTYLAGNIVFLTFALMVLFGTLFPVLVEAVRGAKATVGAPFFNAFAVPLGLLLLLLMGLGPLLPWRRAEGQSLWSALRWPLAAGLAAGLLAYLLGVRLIGVTLTVALSAYNVAGLLQLTLTAARHRAASSGGSALTQLLPLVSSFPRRYGAYVAHIGLVVLALGVAFSSGYKREAEVTLQRGQTESVLGRPVSFLTVVRDDRPEKLSVGARLSVGKELLLPRINTYHNAPAMPVAMPAVLYHPLGDTYATLLAFDPEGQWATVRLIDSPLVPWIWGGTLIMVLGAALTFVPARTPNRAHTPSRQPA
ncbi:cytochrome c-type biogenesis protein CcmF [Deinobacterium chartae]|uniref:Cytochrome c-type biogenesis protein CcmF n=1 Tax=Deinobacterium chartae TaxID=521158 RepID=A0A841HZ93_9DEIO|nr:heme lyase CcmF/NrfE family subunit [Deinobacterium chartae]MBB6098186.1 cytochrome c-type biogenesis protein CcmF [Deinobacterium chartae]